jgi:hypothetical protein
MEFEERPTLSDWLESLGYAAEAESLHRDRGDVPRNHPYAREINTLLSPSGLIQAQAVFAADGTPSVVFIDRSGRPFSQSDIDLVRQRIWNQNLAGIIVEVRGQEAKAYPTGKVSGDDSISLTLKDARPDGPFSARDVKSADLAARKPDWFKRVDRVDHRLIMNISAMVRAVAKDGLPSDEKESDRVRTAQLLVGQVLFISYLEHREIIAETYRKKRQVGSLHELVEKRNRVGLRDLIKSLKDDFNGDFLGDDSHDHWERLNDTGIETINQFLKQTDIRTGQGSFWKYDFSFIPVELLSSLYESFLTKGQKKTEGAVYTPRHVAVLAVDQAFSALPDICSARIFDGACGSGILLTTSLRRLIAEHETRLDRATTFTERRDIVKRQIFGADINAMAGRVTAFSLYLSILEDLTPSDILADQEKFGSKLPDLADENLICSQKGNFFNLQHPFVGQRFDLVLSNPPWVEAVGGEQNVVDDWADSAEEKVIRRQIAAAYALRVQEFLRPGGVVCLILPIGLFLGTTSQHFVRRIFKLTKPIHLINFGDLQQLLFPTAIATCHVYLGTARLNNEPIPFSEEFDYSVPKADLSLAMNRLSLQSSDRHKLSTVEATANNGVLTHFMWGDRNDLALISKLTSYGSLADMTVHPGAGWTIRKGVHLEDKSRTPQSAARLFSYPLYSTTQLNHECPVVAGPVPSVWPAVNSAVVGLDALMRLFDGPRVLFADGFAKQDLSARAVFIKGKGAFTSSVAVIAGQDHDDDLLRFLAIYLRSTMARYLMIMTNAKMLTDRNALHLSEVKAFPFFKPEDAPNPDKAQNALREVAKLSRDLEKVEAAGRVDAYQALFRRFDTEIFDYFDLSDEESFLIREAVDVLLPVIRPRSLERLEEASRDKVSAADIDGYCDTMLASLDRWRDAAGGRGRFRVSALLTEVEESGSLAVASVERIGEDEAGSQAIDNIRADTKLVGEVVKELHRATLIGDGVRQGLNFMPTVEVWLNNKFYVVRPLQRRNWTRRMAMRDADRLVEDVRRLVKPKEEMGSSSL